MDECVILATVLIYTIFYEYKLRSTIVLLVLCLCTSTLFQSPQSLVNAGFLGF